MKYLKRVLLFIILLNCTEIKAQAFERGNINFDLGLGFGIYGTEQITRLSVDNVSIQKDTNSATASTIIPLNFEFGISNKIGLGARVVFNNYIISNKDKENLESVKGTDIALTASYHLLNAPKNDLSIIIAIGGSSIKWDAVADAQNAIESATGSGVYFSLGIKDRIFLSNHIGILFNLNYTAYQYNNIKAEFNDNLSAIFGSTSASLDWDMALKGVNIGTGLAIKF